MENLAQENLKQDPVLEMVLAKIKLRKPRVEKDIYIVLLRSIVGQQLSTKAAAKIWSRFLEIFPEKYPHAELILDLEEQKMRDCGLSFQKSRYIKNIAEFSLVNPLNEEYLNKMTESEIIAYLTTIKGVGKWTVEMILIFALGRPDVFPIEDLGVRNGMIKLYKVTGEGKKLYDKLQIIANQWSPYRSYACMLIWDWNDGNKALN